MLFWLFHPANQLPGDNSRDSRIHSLATELVARGHRCVFWTAAFSHHSKEYRTASGGELIVSPLYRIRILPTPAYQSHVGFARLWFHLVLSWEFWREGRKAERPDCIVANDAPLGDSLASLALARYHRATLILDVTDEWPEHFLLAFPKSVRPLVNRVLFAPIYALRRFVRQRANAITALCRDYFRLIERDITEARQIPLRVFYNGIDAQELRGWMLGTGIAKHRDDNRCTAIYAGTLGATYDILTIISAARLIRERGLPIQIIIAGDGPLRAAVAAEAGVLGSNLRYVGRVSGVQLAELYAESDIGLAAYVAGSTVAMPDKAYDYFAAGLAVVNSLTGELKGWLEDRQAGLSYEAGNPASLADVLGILCQDFEVRKRMRSAAQDLAREFDRVTQYRAFATFAETTALAKD